MTIDLKAYGQRGQRVPVADVAEARAVQEAAIAEGPYGASMWQGGALRVNGKVVARLSYNGRLWALGGGELHDDLSPKAVAR